MGVARTSAVRGASPWPLAAAPVLEEEVALLVVQVNGKVAGQDRGATRPRRGRALAAARADRNVAAHLDGKSVRKTVYVPDRLLNVVAT